MERGHVTGIISSPLAVFIKDNYVEPRQTRICFRREEATRSRAQRQPVHSLTLLLQQPKSTFLSGTASDSCNHHYLFSYFLSSFLIFQFLSFCLCVCLLASDYFVVMLFYCTVCDLSVTVTMHLQYTVLWRIFINHFIQAPTRGRASTYWIYLAAVLCSLSINYVSQR